MFNDKPVTCVRWMSDKQLPYMPISEENPCLGWRIALRLDQPEIFDPGAGDAAC